MTKGYQKTRRQFVRDMSVAGSLLLPYHLTSARVMAESSNDRPHFGSIGIGGRGKALLKSAKKLGDIVAVCDVDRKHTEAANEMAGGKSAIFGDYRKLLERDDIDAVIIGTPDHWHTKIAIEAMLSGKDVYCEKPLTLTIDEGRQICEVAKKTNRVFQVGTQQRSEYKGRFLQAVAMIREGRIGKLRRVTASTGGGKSGGPFTESKSPDHLDWDMWLGQAPKVEYTKERCHKQFRWWREYAGGQMTDWGAHHVDISLWAMGIPESGQLKISGTGNVPAIPNGYNMPAKFEVDCIMPDGVLLKLVTGQRQGIMFEGDKGRFFVNRGTISGKPIEDLADNPLPEDAITKVYKGKQPGSHMSNFVECLKSRDQPISDVFSHHRAVSVLHLANLCLLLKRELTWDLATEQIIGDDEANSHQKREQRKGYEITVS